MPGPPPLPKTQVPRKKSRFVLGCLLAVIGCFAFIVFCGVLLYRHTVAENEKFAAQRDDIVQNIASLKTEGELEEAQSEALKYERFNDPEIGNLLDEIKAIQQSREAELDALQAKIDKEFIQYCIDNRFVTSIEQNYVDNFYVTLPSVKYTTEANVKSIAEWISRAYVLQNETKGGRNRSATVHVFKGSEVYARGSFRLPNR